MLVSLKVDERNSRYVLLVRSDCCKILPCSLDAMNAILRCLCGLEVFELERSTPVLSTLFASFIASDVE